MFSRCQEVVALSQSPVKRRTRCARSSAPFKLPQLKTQTARARTPRGSSQEEENIAQLKAPGDWCLRRCGTKICARARGAPHCRIGRRARRPPRAGLKGSLLEGPRVCQDHEGGARAPLGGVLRGTFPSGRHEARRAQPSGVHQQGRSGATGIESHARHPPPAWCSPPSERGWRAARLHRLPRD